MLKYSMPDCAALEAAFTQRAHEQRWPSRP
jgi:hypothetical protein